MNKNLLIILTIFLSLNLFSQETGVYKDSRDGNTYKVVKLGSQIWMSDNLKYKTPNSVYYNNDSLTNAQNGRLYNFNEAYNVCPAGWHLPSDDEWKELEKLAGISDKVLNKHGAKSSYRFFKNESIFSSHNGVALKKSGRYTSNGNFKSKNKSGYFWTSTALNTDKAWIRHVTKSKEKEVLRQSKWKDNSYSVHCIADSTANMDMFTIVEEGSKYSNKTKSELEKLLKAELVNENYEEAELISSEIKIKAISEKYKNKSTDELNNLIEQAVTNEDYEKAEEVQTIIDNRNNLSKSLSLTELKMLQKEALAKEDYERADKIKTIITINNNIKTNIVTETEPVVLSKYVGRKYGKTKIYFSYGYRNATGQFGKAVEEGGWGGTSGFGFDLGMQIPIFREKFKNNKSLNAGLDFAFNYRNIQVFWDMNYSAVESIYNYNTHANEDVLVNFKDEKRSLARQLIPFSFDYWGNELDLLGANFGGFINLRVPNSKFSVDLIYKIGLSYTSLSYYYSGSTSIGSFGYSACVEAFSFRKYLSVNIHYGKLFANVGYEWGRTFNTTVDTSDGEHVVEYTDQKVPTGMFGVSIGVMF